MLLGIDASRANDEKKTGVGWYAWHTIQELKKIDVSDLQVRLYSREPLKGALAELPENWESKVLAWPPKRLWTQVRLSIEMKQHAPDVLFVPAHVFPLIHPKKTVMTVHDVAAWRFPEVYSRFERWYSLWSAHVAMKKLWRVIVPTVATKKELLAYTDTVDTGRVIVIPHGVNSDYFKVSDAEEIRNKLGITKPYILTVGRMEEKKNTLALVRAFNEVKKEADMQLVLVGPPGYGADAILSAIQESPYQADIVTLGWIETADIVLLMACARIFAFPSVYEGFGMPILEALAAGVPTVTSDIECLREVGGDACTYVRLGNIEQLTDALLRVHRTPKDERDAGVEKGKVHARVFSWENTARQTLAVLLSN